MLLVLLACAPKPPVVAPLAPPAPVVVVDPAEARRADEVALPLVEAMAQAYGEGDVARALALGQQVQREAPASRYAGLAAGWMADLATIGQPFPELVVERWYQGEAPVAPVATLYVFFEAWCPHCQEEMPTMQSVADTYAPRGLAVVGLTRLTRGLVDADVFTFLAERSVAFPVAKELDGGMTLALGVDGIPATVIARDGKIAWRGHPSLLTTTLLDSLTAPSPERH